MCDLGPTLIANGTRAIELAVDPDDEPQGFMFPSHSHLPGDS